MKEVEEKILSIMTIYYNNQDKAMEWYEKPSIYFSVGFKDKASPKDMVEENRGKEVIEWLELLLY